MTLTMKLIRHSLFCSYFNWLANLIRHDESQSDTNQTGVHRREKWLQPQTSGQSDQSDQSDSPGRKIDIPIDIPIYTHVHGV